MEWNISEKDISKLIGRKPRGPSLLQLLNARARPLDSAGLERTEAGARTARLPPERDCTALVQLRAAFVALYHLLVKIDYMLEESSPVSQMKTSERVKKLMEKK